MIRITPWLLVPLVFARQQIDPALYAKVFMNNRPMFDRLSGLVTEQLGENGGAVLDLGSGPGEPTVTLAKACPKCRVLCTDVQQAMNDKAKVRAAGLHNVDFATMSADDMSSILDDTFDAVLMSYVLMFVPDQAKSLREIERVLKPGGVAYIAVWKELPLYDTPVAAVKQLTSKEDIEFEINPMALGGNNAVEELVAGVPALEVVTSELLAYDFTFASVAESVDVAMMIAGPTVKKLEEDGQSGVTDEFRKIYAAIVQERGWQGEKALVVPGNTAQILRLRKKVRDEEL